MLAIFGLIAAAAYWYFRVQRAKNAVETIAGAADDVRLAARRFGFRHRANVHPVDQIEDPRLAAAGLAAAIAGMDGPLTETELRALGAQARVHLGASAEEADDLAAFGRWIAGQCGAEDEAARRLGRAAHRLTKGEGGAELMTYLLAVAGDGAASPRAADALGRVARQFDVEV